jgi:dTDP-4-amino-4,6-dideoxygalactose transaminase
MDEHIPVYKPFLGQPEFNAAQDALELGWLGMGSYVGDFELAIKTLLQADDRHVVAVSTGHAALHLALLLIGAGPGDEIITPSFNNIADIQAIRATGAEPVFVDIHQATLSVNLDEAEKMITPRTKAIIVMDYACHLCDHERVAWIAKQYGIRIIHDAAHAFGSKYDGKPVGSFSDIAMFSFDPVKTITTIDGGALVVRTPEEVQALQEMRLIGMKQSSKIMYGNQRAWNYDVERLGFRYHLANLHAAIGLGQLSKFEVITQTRRDLFRHYQDALSDLPGVKLPIQDVSEIVPFMFYVRVLNDRRNDLISFLKKEGIDTGIHWQPAHGFTLFKDCLRGPLPITETIGNEILSLPFHSNMISSHRDRVVQKLRDFFSAD